MRLRIVSVFLKEGWSGVWGRLKDRVAKFLLLEQEFLCLEADLVALTPRYTVRAHDVVVRPVTLEDIPAVAARLSRAEMRAFRKHFRKGGFGVAAFVGGRIIGHFGMKTGTYNPPDVRYPFSLGPHVVYTNGIVVDQEYRQTIVPGALLECGLLYFRGQGYTKTIAIIETTNRSSLRISSHFGYQEMHRIVSRRILMIRRRPRIVYNGSHISSITRRRRLPDDKPLPQSEPLSMYSEASRVDP